MPQIIELFYALKCVENFLRRTR